MPTSSRDRIILYPAERRDAVLEAIDSARTRLALSIYRLDDAEVLAALARARRRSVDVQVLVTERVKGSSGALNVLLAALAAADLSVRRYVHLPKYHAKYIIADDRLALVGSFNFTTKCFEDTCDFAVLTRDREVIDGLTRLFDADYHGRSAGRFGSRLIVGPDAARGRYAALVGQARHSLRLVDHKLTDDEMRRLIRERGAAGVAVRVLGRGELAPLLPHGKLIIVDSQVAAIGSIALTAKNLDRRRELAIVLRDRASVELLRDYFDSFAAGAPVRPDTRRRPARLSHCQAV